MDPITPVDWLRSVPRAVRMLACRSVRLPRERVGTPLVTSDGRAFTPFRQTVVSPPRAGIPVVLQPRFRLRGMGPRAPVRHALFRRVCIVTTPFFVGIPGFRSKLWMYDASTGSYAGLYEWDGESEARAYAEGLCALLCRLSAPRSVSYELVVGLTVDEYLARCDVQPPTRAVAART